MDEPTNDNNVADLAKSVAAQIAKEVITTAAGVMIGTGLFVGASVIAGKVMSFRRNKTTETDPQN